MAIENLRVRTLFDSYGKKKKSPWDIDFGDTTKSPSTNAFDAIEFEAAEPSLDTPSQTSTPRSEYRHLMDELPELFKQETVDRDRYRALLDQFPTREEPDWKTKLIASGASLGNVRRKIPGGVDAADRVMYAPYLREAAEWKEKTEPYAKAAQFENTANQAERQLASSILQAETWDKRIEEQARQADLKNEVAKTRAAAYAWKQYHPDWKFDFDGPQIIAVSPDGKESKYLGPTGHMDEEAKINLQNWGRIEAARVTGEGAAERTNIANLELYQEEGTNNIWEWNPREMKWIPHSTGAGPEPRGKLNPINRGAGATPRQLSPDQENTALSNKLRDIYFAEPKNRKFIEQNESDGSYRLIEPPGPGWFSSNKAEIDAYQAFVNRIQGRTPAVSGTQKPALTAPPAQPAPAAPPQDTRTPFTEPLPPTRPSTVPGAGISIPRPPISGTNPLASIFGATQPSQTAPPQTRPQAKPGYVIIMKGGQIVGQIPEAEREEAIRQGYAVVR